MAEVHGPLQTMKRDARSKSNRSHAEAALTVVLVLELHQDRPRNARRPAQTYRVPSTDRVETKAFFTVAVGIASMV